MKRRRLSLTGISVLVLTLALGVAACDSDPGTGGGNDGLTVPGVSQLPDFPEGAAPATETNVDAVLKAIKDSGIVQDIYERMDDVVQDEAGENYGNGNYNVANKEGDNVKVISASQEIDYTMSKNVEDIAAVIENMESETDMMLLVTKQLTTSDSVRFSAGRDMKGVTTDDTADGTVTVVGGCAFEEQMTASGNASTAKKGTLFDAELKMSANAQSQSVAAFTAVTSGGSVKIILNAAYTTSASSTKNFTVMEIMGIMEGDEDGDLPLRQTDSYSGSLKVYGEGSAPLKTVAITNEETYRKALELIGYPDNLPEGGLDIGGLSPF